MCRFLTVFCAAHPRCLPVQSRHVNQREKSSYARLPHRLHIKGENGTVLKHLGRNGIVNRPVITSSVVLVVPIAMLAIGLSGSSQPPASRIPDLSGVWGWGRCVDGTGFNCMIIEPDDPLLTDRARGFQAAFDEIAALKYDCAPMSIPHLYTDPYAYKIEQMDDRVILSYEKDDVVRYGLAGGARSREAGVESVLRPRVRDGALRGERSGSPGRSRSWTDPSPLRTR